MIASPSRSPERPLSTGSGLKLDDPVGGPLRELGAGLSGDRRARRSSSDLRLWGVCRSRLCHGIARTHRAIVQLQSSKGKEGRLGKVRPLSRSDGHLISRRHSGLAGTRAEKSRPALCLAVNAGYLSLLPVLSSTAGLSAVTKPTSGGEQSPRWRRHRADGVRASGRVIRHDARKQSVSAGGHGGPAFSASGFLILSRDA